MSAIGEHSVGLRELRHHTSDVIARVRHGETIDVTEHGRPVARIVPIESVPRPPILARLEAEGRLRRAERPGYVPARLHSSREGDELTRALREDRDSERW